ncbi:hypothetical protein B9T36_11075 [Acinetobacter sp. ANC 4204]|uniref:HIRAN domain-containing protein n=1 Tax=Acinetobacter sp. ANC 4204 TaxID=1977884 RepID=UPI000A32BF91|nr:HIRAN domain-containing protein [Acinetobacter sp. ANC 4204]OTG58872.1 hypothetical protein B9T36_11075 [Acinetobacter sp. ANC 4204]
MDFILGVIILAIIWYLIKAVRSRPNNANNIDYKNYVPKPKTPETLSNQSTIVLGTEPPKYSEVLAYRVYGDESFAFDIVGEASYQQNLMQIAGAKNEVRKSHNCIAIIRAEPTNPHDPNAVVVGVDNKIVGYFDRDTAKKFHKLLQDKNLNEQVIIAVEAKVVGGWADQYSTGDYGVKLDVPRSLGKWELDRIEN